VSDAATDVAFALRDVPNSDEIPSEELAQPDGDDSAIELP
jgi:hypothetical protein